MNLTTVLVLAVLIEALIDAIKRAFTDQATLYWENIVAFVLGGLLAYIVGFDLFGVIGLDVVNGPDWLIALLNAFFSGVLLLRGSGGVNDLLDKLTQLRGG